MKNQEWRSQNLIRWVDEVINWLETIERKGHSQKDALKVLELAIKLQDGDYTDENLHGIGEALEILNTNVEYVNDSLSEIAENIETGQDDIKHYNDLFCHYWKYEGDNYFYFNNGIDYDCHHINKIDVAMGTKLYEFCENERVKITNLSNPNEYLGIMNNRRGTCVRIYLKSEHCDDQKALCIQFHKGAICMKLEDVENEISGYDVWRN